MQTGGPTPRPPKHEIKRAKARASRTKASQAKVSPHANTSTVDAVIVEAVAQDLLLLDALRRTCIKAPREKSILRWGTSSAGGPSRGFCSLWIAQSAWRKACRHKDAFANIYTSFRETNLGLLGGPPTSLAGQGSKKKQTPKPI